MPTNTGQTLENRNDMFHTVRLFIAIDLPESLRRTLSDRQENLRRELKDIAIGWSRIEGIHLTMKFLGNVEESRVSEIDECMTKIAEAWNPMQLELRAIGVFPTDVYYISRIPVEIRVFDVLAVALSAILISLLATIYPSRQAAKLDPAVALRYE